MAPSALIWLRRDLRLRDNPALDYAVGRGQAPVPLYIHAPEEEAPWPPGAASRWWLHHSLDALSGELTDKGSRLILLQGPSMRALVSALEATGAEAVYWNRLYEPAVVRRDESIKRQLRQRGIDARSFNGALLHEPWEVLTAQGNPYKVFTPFWKATGKLPGPARPTTRPRKLAVPGAWPKSASLDDFRLLPKTTWYEGIAAEWGPGERRAQRRLRYFAGELVADYAELRDMPAVKRTSRLSPHLHYGELSVRDIWHTLKSIAAERRAEARIEPFLRQLIWREFAHHLLHHFPHTQGENFRGEFAAFPWRDDTDFVFEAWTRGETGIPLVDAGMRELWTTGYMHNRVRMVAASFLSKNAMLHWLHGARWFWDTLVDADLANNTLGWQWSAGCGADAAPYFRIFNPVRQSQRFDPQGEYLRRWLPELRILPAAHIHAPWEAPQSALKDAGVILGRSYPEPVLELKQSRRMALEAYNGTVKSVDA